MSKTESFLTETYRTSSFCSFGDCVGVGTNPETGDVSIYDTKIEDPKERAQKALVFDRAEWGAFVAGVKAGEFDPTGPDSGEVTFANPQATPKPELRTRTAASEATQVSAPSRPRRALRRAAQVLKPVLRRAAI